MCLEIETNGFKRIAEKDITVYKVLNKDNTSSILRFHYDQNGRYKLDAFYRESFEHAVEYGRVYEGFHAYTDKSHADANLDGQFEKTVAFTVPKGAHYYLGIFYDIVADTIIAGDLTEL